MNMTLIRLEERVADGDEFALAEVFSQYRERLRRIIESRMDRRLKRRIDSSDVLQETYIDLTRKMAAYAEVADRISIFVWMRKVAIERLIQLHRQHINAEKRDARKEVPLSYCETPTFSRGLPAGNRSDFSTEACRAIQKEMHETVFTVLCSLNNMDSEIIMLRCIDELSNVEVARTLELSQNGASSRFVRAMFRLKQRLRGKPDFVE